MRSCSAWLRAVSRQAHASYVFAGCADRDGIVLDNPPLPEDICADSLLGALKLIAWSGDDALLPHAGVRGFPHWGVWLQRNTRFSADLKPFVAGLPATASGMATRLLSPPFFKIRQQEDCLHILPSCVVAHILEGAWWHAQ